MLSDLGKRALVNTAPITESLGRFISNNGYCITHYRLQRDGCEASNWCVLSRFYSKHLRLALALRNLALAENSIIVVAAAAFKLLSR